MLFGKKVLATMAAMAILGARATLFRITGLPATARPTMAHRTRDTAFRTRGIRL
jgi:hypothetical protein